MSAIIRRLRDEDADVVSKLVCRNFLEVNIKDYPLAEMEQLASVFNREKILDMNKWAHSYVACVEGVVVGCGSIAQYWGKIDESILLTIFVLPELHGRGIGTQIIKALEADDLFLKAKRIEIPSSITARDFYRKLGYDYKGGVMELNDEKQYRLEKFNSV